MLAAYHFKSVWVVSFSMFKLVNFFLDIALLKRAPQDLPASGVIFFVVVLLNVMVATVGIADLIPGAAAMAAAITDAVLILVLLRLVLMIQGRSARFVQTATAIFGSGIVLGLIALPLQLSIEQNSEGTEAGVVVSLAYLTLLVWSQLVIAHVLRHALNVSFALGVGLALVYSLLSGVIIQALFITPTT
jgi:hypothetical protein